MTNKASYIEIKWLLWHISDFHNIPADLYNLLSIMHLLRRRLVSQAPPPLALNPHSTFKNHWGVEGTDEDKKVSIKVLHIWSTIDSFSFLCGSKMCML